MKSEDRQVYSVCILQFSKYNRMQSKYLQIKFEHSRRNSYRYNFLSRYHYTKSKNYFLGHPALASLCLLVNL